MPEEVLLQIGAEIAQGHLDECAADDVFPVLMRRLGTGNATRAGIERGTAALAVGRRWGRLERVELVRRVPGQVRVEHATQGLDQVTAPGSRLADDQQVTGRLQRQLRPAPEPHDAELDNPHWPSPRRSVRVRCRSGALVRSLYGRTAPDANGFLFHGLSYQAARPSQPGRHRRGPQSRQWLATNRKPLDTALILNML